MLKHIHYIIYLFIIIALGLLLAANNIQLSVRVAIVILVLGGICGGFLQGNALRFTLSQRQMSSFKHEVQHILVALSNRSDNNQVKFGQFLRFKEAILLFQIETKGLWQNKTYWNIKDLIQATVDDYSEYAKSVSIQINIELDESAPVSVNENALNIALAILLSNAIGVTPRGASIEIKGKPNKDRTAYLLAIADGGSGIPTAIIHSFGKKTIHHSSTPIDLHGMRRYGNGLNFLARLQKKANFNVKLHHDKSYSASISIPLASVIPENKG